MERSIATLESNSSCRLGTINLNKELIMRLLSLVSASGQNVIVNMSTFNYIFYMKNGGVGISLGQKNIVYINDSSIEKLNLYLESSLPESVESKSWG